MEERTASAVTLPFPDLTMDWIMTVGWSSTKAFGFCHLGVAECWKQAFWFFRYSDCMLDSDTRFSSFLSLPVHLLLPGEMAAGGVAAQNLRMPHSHLAFRVVFSTSGASKKRCHEGRNLG